jgi:methylmalonyl-CoA mutase N-terminal domain/subunit
MRQYAGFGSAEETNQRFRFLLEQGQTGLSVAFDLPTQIGFDPDHPLAAGEVGRVGVSIASLQNLLTLFDGIPLDRVSTSMTINAPAAILLAMYIGAGRRQGVAEESLQGTIQNDILKEYTSRGTYIFPPVPAMRLIIDTFAYGSQHLPRFNTISVSGYHIREAGATAVQEVAFTLANGLAYVEAAQKAGLLLEEFVPRMSFFFSSDSNFLEEIAKFRSARRLWSRLLLEKFGVTDPRPRQLRFHTQTAGSSLTAQQPQNNAVRVALQALSAILGGTQSLHTNATDEALGLPTAEAAQLALRTQQILAHETGVAEIVDPLAGSFTIERLTNEIEERTEAYLDEIDRVGGALRAIETGYIQREIQDSAYTFQRRVELGERTVVGVNRFQDENEPTIHAMEVRPEVEEAQRRHLEELRHDRDGSEVEAALDSLSGAARGDQNLMPFLIQAVSVKSTLGEICQVLRQEWGEYTAPATV